MTIGGGFDRIRMLWPDHLGLARGKYVPARLAHAGSGFCVTTFGLSYAREAIDAPGAYLTTGMKDLHGVIDPDSMHPSWEDDRTGVAVADLGIGGEPYAVSSRAALRRSIAAWNQAGYVPKAGFELEGYLLSPTPGGGWDRYPNPRSMVYGTGRLGDPSGFLDEVLWTADRCGFAVESASVEFDEAQFEFTLEYGDALQLADDTFLFRLMVREIAIARGLDFTFLGRPFPAVAGSGLHVNISLATRDGRNCFDDPTATPPLSELGRQCIAGLIAHHQAITALCAPTVNAYRRLQPGQLSGCWANWGVDHRHVTNRIPAEGGPAMRIENRLGDGAMSIHLGLTAVLEAARLGVVGSLVPPPPLTGDGRVDSGTDVRSATSLADALDHLEADHAIVETVGATLVANFVATKRAEVDRFEASGGRLDSAELSRFETATYLPYH